MFREYFDEIYIYELTKNSCESNNVLITRPFFKMVLHKDPGQATTILDIDVLSGLVKVGYDRVQGGKPNVDVSVFGFGSNGRRPPYTPETKPEEGDAEPV